MRVHQQSAFVLFNRPYSESSWIVELLSREYGRLAVIAKGARRIKSRYKGVLLPFQPLLVSWVGKGEMPTLTSAEIQTSEIDLFDYDLHGDALICGFYCNELLLYLLHRHDPHPQLFDAYCTILRDIHNSKNNDHQLALHLRKFEQIVIRETGYAINFKYEVGGKKVIEAQQTYRYEPDEGFYACSINHPRAVSGKVILSLHQEPFCRETELNLNKDQFHMLDTLSGADVSQGKHLMRAILGDSLGNRKINSRELFIRGT